MILMGGSTNVKKRANTTTTTLEPFFEAARKSEIEIKKTALNIKSEEIIEKDRELKKVKEERAEMAKEIFALASELGVKNISTSKGAVQVYEFYKQVIENANDAEAKHRVYSILEKHGIDPLDVFGIDEKKLAELEKNSKEVKKELDAVLSKKEEKVKVVKTYGD